MTKTTTTGELDAPRAGDLRVWFVPRVSGPAFTRRAGSMREAVAVLDAISDFCLFAQDVARAMPDQANAGGVARWDGEDWEDVDEDELRELGWRD